MVSFLTWNQGEYLHGAAEALSFGRTMKADEMLFEFWIRDSFVILITDKARLYFMWKALKNALLIILSITMFI